MSSIDQYRHEHLGFIQCSSSFDLIFNNSTRSIAIYRLLQDIPETETGFDGKFGDIIVGGGSGEASAFRISAPEAFMFFFDEDPAVFDPGELFRAFWSPTDSFRFCEGYQKLGWDPKLPIEPWLAENVCSVLVENFEDYSEFKTKIKTNSRLPFEKLV